jgi:glycosyltransferase involved in cell wall biosynthesis
MSGELVSVVIPTYNYGRFVTEAVDSVLAQTYPHVEVIVVDDGSTDDTRQRLEHYRGRVVYVCQDNQGLSAARNTGIRLARGPFVALLDADDVWHPRKLELQMDFLAAHPEVALLGSDLFTDRRERWEHIGAVPQAAEVTFDDVVYRAHFAPSSVVARKKCLLSVGLFDPELRCVEDREMWIRFARHFRMARLPLPLMWYRIHPASLSGKAARMEEHEWRVLHQAFTAVAELRWRPLFRLKTFGYAAFNAAYMYGSCRQWRPALGRAFLSMLLWPLPFGRTEVDRPLARPRMVAVYVLRMLGLRPPEPVPAAITAPALRTAAPLSPA